jgi:hypothetical protein
MKTRTYLIAMMIAILIPSVFFAWLGLNRLLEVERNARFDAVEETARATALAIDQEVANAKGALPKGHYEYSQILISLKKIVSTCSMN